MANLRRQRRGYLIALLLVCPLLAYVSMPHPRDFSVEARGRRIVDASDWFPSGIAGGKPYQWLTDHTIVARRTEMTAILDTVSGNWSSLHRIEAAIHDDPAAEGYQNNARTEYLASPDGRWLMTLVWPECVVSTLNGSKVETFSIPENTSSILWDNDSRGFLTIDQEGSVYTWRHYTLGSRQPGDQTDRLLGFHTLYRVYPLAVLSDKRILAVTWQGEPGEVALHIWSMAGGPRQTIHISLPPGAQYREAEVSPDRRRLGSILDFRGKIDPDVSHLPFTPIVPGHSFGEIWLSGIDGSNMHPVATTGAGLTNGATQYLRWTRDGKQLTFVFRNTLYSVPAE